MLTAAGAEAREPQGELHCQGAAGAAPSVLLAMRALIRDTVAIQALAKHEKRDRWLELCGPSVLQCLSAPKSLDFITWSR